MMLYSTKQSVFILAKGHPTMPTTEIVSVWQNYFATFDWQTALEKNRPRITGCGLVYELANPLNRPHESCALADMRKLHFSEPHYHKEAEFYFILQGTGLVVVGYTEQLVETGSVVIIPPDTAHFVIPHKDLVLAVVNNPPFALENYTAVQEDNPAVKFSASQFSTLTNCLHE